MMVSVTYSTGRPTYEKGKTMDIIIRDSNGNTLKVNGFQPSARHLFDVEASRVEAFDAKAKR